MYKLKLEIIKVKENNVKMERKTYKLLNQWITLLEKLRKCNELRRLKLFLLFYSEIVEESIGIWMSWSRWFGHVLAFQKHTSFVHMCILKPINYFTMPFHNFFESSSSFRILYCLTNSIKLKYYCNHCFLNYRWYILFDPIAINAKFQ